MSCLSCGVSLPESAKACPSCGVAVDTLLGRVLGEKYQIVKKLGEGGMGAVYQAEEPKLKRQVAIKTLHPHLTTNKAAASRFLQEGIAASKLDHPSAVKIYDTGETPDGHLWIAMEFLHGKDLAAHLKSKGRLTPEEMMALLGPILDVLGEAHQKNMVHRDLKPQNIMLAEVAGKLSPKLLDFGISKIEGADTKTQENSMMGTPQYMPPEQWGKASEVSPASDVYSLGVIVYQLVSGVFPFIADNVKSWMTAHCLEAPKPLAPLIQSHPKAAAIETVVMKALAKDPAQRYPTAVELKRSLEEACSPGFAASAQTMSSGDSSAIKGSAPAQRLGRVVAGKYKLIREMGAGGMGAVYEAEHTELHHKVALKMLHPHYAKSAEINKRFQEEARRSVSLKHPGIIEVTDLGTDNDGSPYLTMELLQGRSISEMLKAGPLSIELAVEIAASSLEALLVAHEKGIVHRDLKPENIFYATDAQGKARAKILDFGISKALDSQDGALTKEGSMIGTPVYMSLEQATDSSKVDHRSDIYSLGATLFEMLTNKHSLKGLSVNELLTHLATDELERHPKKLRPEIPEWLDSCVAKAMAQRPEDRFQSAKEMLAQLNQAPAAKPVTLDTLAPTKKSATPLFVGGGAAALALVGVLLFTQSTPQEKAKNNIAQPTQSATIASTSQPLPTKTLEAKTLPEPEGEVLTLEIEAVKIEERDGKIVKDSFLTSGDTLKNGDFFELSLSVNQDAYVYIVVLSSEGDVAVLLPQEGDILLKKGEPKRLPEGTEDGFDVSGKSGYENLYAIVSSVPISKADSEVSQLISDIRGGKLPAVKPEKLRADAQAPQGLPGDGARAIGIAKVVPKKSRGLSAKVTEAKVNEQGLALVHLWFKHL